MPEKKYAEKKAEKKGYAIGNGSSIMMVYNLCEQEGNHKMREIRWAVLGTGVIANEMAAALEKNGKKLPHFQRCRNFYMPVRGRYDIPIGYPAYFPDFTANFKKFFKKHLKVTLGHLL